MFAFVFEWSGWSWKQFDTFYSELSAAASINSFENLHSNPSAIVWAGWNRAVRGCLGEQWTMSNEHSLAFRISHCSDESGKISGVLRFPADQLEWRHILLLSPISRVLLFSHTEWDLLFPPLFFCVYCAFLSFAVHIRGQILRDDEQLLCMLP